MGLIFAILIMTLFQPHMNPTTAKFTAELNQSSENERDLTHKSNISIVLKEKMEK